MRERRQHAWRDQQHGFHRREVGVEGASDRAPGAHEAERSLPITERRDADAGTFGRLAGHGAGGSVGEAREDRHVVEHPEVASREEGVAVALRRKDRVVGAAEETVVEDDEELHLQRAPQLFGRARRQAHGARHEVMSPGWV